jgi:hypothetical protein
VKATSKGSVTPFAIAANSTPGAIVIGALQAARNISD